jgi:hypothetical protein
MSHPARLKDLTTSSTRSYAFGQGGSVNTHNRTTACSTAWACFYGHNMQHARREPHRETGVTPPRSPACQADVLTESERKAPQPGRRLRSTRNAMDARGWASYGRQPGTEGRLLLSKKDRLLLCFLPLLFSERVLTGLNLHRPIGADPEPARNPFPRPLRLPTMVVPAPPCDAKNRRQTQRGH